MKQSGTTIWPGDTPLGRPPRRPRVEIGVPNSFTWNASVYSVRSARVQYSRSVAFVASKSFITGSKPPAERSRRACFVAFSMLVARPIDNLRVKVCQRDVSAKGTLCSSLQLHPSATLRARNRLYDRAQFCAHRCPHEPRSHRRFTRIDSTRPSRNSER